MVLYGTHDMATITIVGSIDAGNTKHDGSARGNVDLFSS
jgi:hypothetical protein